MKTKKITVWAAIISATVIVIIILVFATSANTAEGDEQVSANTTGENIFSFSGDQYFPFFEGEWVAVEYVGAANDSLPNESYTEEYWADREEEINEIIEEYLGSEYRIEINNMKYFRPITELGYIIENDDDLFFCTRFTHLDFPMTPPYIGACVYLLDKDETYNLIIDNNGTLLIQIKYAFFRLERKSETENQIQLIIDDDIVLNDLFIQFIKGNVYAYSYGEEKYIADYYKEDSTREINVVHFMAEDLNGDGENELLININWTYADGIILAFHCQDGDLFEWESIRYGMHSPKVTLYPDVNIVEVTGTRWTRSFFTYNSQGGQEEIFSCSSIEDNLEDGSFRRQYLITVYQDGIAKEEYSVEEIFDKNDNVVFVSSEEETLIFDSVLDDFLNMLGEGKEISSTQNDVEVTDTVISGNANSTNNTDDYVPDEEWEAATGEDVIAFFDTITEDITGKIDGINLLEYIEKYVTLTDDTEIERWEMLNHNGENILRIRVGYNQDDLRGTIQGHKEDYFIFLNGNGEAGYVLQVGYEDKWVGAACGYSAHFEDVTFDGNDDLLICLGGSKAQGYCAFIYENGQYRYEKSFENIPDYEVDAQNHVIRGSNPDSATAHTYWTFEYRNGEFVEVEEKTIQHEYRDGKLVEVEYINGVPVRIEEVE